MCGKRHIIDLNKTELEHDQDQDQLLPVFMLISHLTCCQDTFTFIF